MALSFSKLSTGLVAFSLV